MLSVFTIRTWVLGFGASFLSFPEFEKPVRKAAEKTVSAFLYIFYPECSTFDPASASKRKTKNNLT
jgi:hypothetical protein